MMNRFVTTGLVVALVALTPVCRADIYAYTDAAGTTHFSNVPDDARYRLIVRTPPVAVAGAETPDARRAASWLSRSTDYDAAIARAAQTANVRPELVRAVIVVESGFNPRAISRRGAIGLMQLLPTTARRYGAFNAFDPEQNIRAGALYLSDLIARFGEKKLELVLAAYNAGENAVEKYGRHVPPYRETRAYVPNVLKMYEALRAQTLLAAANTTS
ncbi:MAG TPA: lytic transglycosylase domain-containing protein [Steroidobacteraceae bacterium]|nr:lytic transglycosylase domain-containing protein [Steroidobacteraceae bacterium]